MPKFQVTDATSGKKYILTAPDQASAIAAFKQFSGQGSAPQYPTDAQGHIDIGNPMAQGAPAPEGPPITFGDLGNQISAGFTSGVDALPIIGPTVLGGLEQVKAKVQGRTPQDVAASDLQQVKENPVPSTIGAITGTVAPFMLGGQIPVVSRLLGMSGGIPSRIMLGGLSGGVINAADTAARGGNPSDVIGAAGIGAGLGGTLPLAERGIGLLAGKFAGKSVPREAVNLSRAFKADAVPISDVNSRLAQMGDGSMVMDLGPNLQRQAGALASVPGEAQQTIREAVGTRKAGTSDRVAADVAATVGAGPEIDALKQQIVTAQSAAAKPLYDAVRDKAVPMTGNIKFVFQTPMGKKAFATAVQMAKNDGYGYQTGTTVGLIDYAKQALDDVASQALRAGKNNEARQASNMARLLRTEADKAVPGYKTARDVFAGHAAVLDAIDQGSAAFTKDSTPAQLRAVLDNMSASERDAFLQGARASIESQMGNAVNDALSLRNMFKKGYNEQKLRIILGNTVADDLMQRISREATFGNSANVVTGNSETAARQAAQAEVAPELGRVPRPQGLTGLLFSAFDAARQALHGKVQPRVNAHMAQFHIAHQLSPEQIKMLSGVRQPGPSLLAPAVPGLLLNKEPLQITVNGGR